MSQPLYAAQLSTYLDELVPSRPPEIQAMEAYAKENRFPIIGPAAGNLCFLIARMTGARKIFELGSGFGYSTAWFAKAVQENGGGEVHHVVWDDELSQQARAHLKTLGFEQIVQYHVSEAIQTLREVEGPFDLIFIDIDKSAYPEALPVTAEKLRPGGVLIADNMFWQGRIFDQNDRDETTEGIRNFTERITTDDNWVSSLAPIRDGLLIAFKQ